jgi:hypothetical protein
LTTTTEKIGKEEGNRGERRYKRGKDKQLQRSVWIQHTQNTITEKGKGSIYDGGGKKKRKKEGVRGR